jgi:hypothetical protein
MFSGLISAYQTAELEDAHEPMSTSEFHVLLQDAFVVSS